MITALDHVVLLCPDIEQGMEDYTIVMGADPVWQTDADGAATALFHAGNTCLELMAPSGSGSVADSIRDLTQSGPRLSTLVYQSDDLGADHHLMTRRGLSPSDISPGTSVDLKTQSWTSWSRFRIPDEAAAGIKSFVLERNDSLDRPVDQIMGSVSGLDHLVINTPNPERAVAFYGARLGLRFALDRNAPQWKTRFLFFRVGGLTLEVIHRLDQDHDSSASDEIWGATWAVDDLRAAHDRLTQAGLDISEIRTGRKPGSEVFTLRNGTLGIPTLFIHHTPR
ncbi:MAG: VOC family protein [Henriciella sp.]|nr:VOC family protein [Henriciella sp.]